MARQGAPAPTPATIVASVPDSLGTVEKVELLGAKEPLTFTQDASGLNVNLPTEQPGKHSFTLKITGLNMNVAP